MAYGEVRTGHVNSSGPVCVRGAISSFGLGRRDCAALFVRGPTGLLVPRNISPEKLQGVPPADAPLSNASMTAAPLARPKGKERDP
jgi:hypothetical protein